MTAIRYERATIRAIATDADIDPSMGMRYFGSKDGLFAAAASFDLASQLLGMAYCRYVVKMPALIALDERVIVSKLGETIQRYLDGPIDER